MTTPTPPRDVLLPCPFCGGEPTTSKRMDEDLWTHNIVEWRGVRCTDCDIGFDWPPGSEVSAAEQWNRRADRIESALAVQGEVDVRVFRICEHCHQEYMLTFGPTGISNFGPCPNCKRRDDPWIRVARTQEPR